MVEMVSSVKNFNEPMKELGAMIVSEKLKHPGNPVLTWAMSNVVCHTDRKDQIFPNKERPENKIDLAIALIMAMGRGVILGPKIAGSNERIFTI